MPINWKFPTSKDLNFVVDEFAGLAQAEMIGHQIAPIVNEETYQVEWDEKSKLQGMTSPVAPDTDAPHDVARGVMTKRFTPVEFAQFQPIKRSKIEQARVLGTQGQPIDLTRLITEALTDQLQKTHLRIEWMIWQMFLGSLAVNENGVTFTETFGVQTYNAATPWATVATATPKADFDAVALLFRGTGAGAEGAVAYANRATVNSLLQNVNSNDLHGLQQGATTVTLTIQNVNTVLEANGLPRVQVFDGGYIDSNNNFTLFIPDNRVIVLGRRPAGQRIADFPTTPSLHNTQNGVPRPGVWGKQVVKIENEETPYVSAGAGFKGGPRMYYEKSVVVMTV